MSEILAVLPLSCFPERVKTSLEIIVVIILLPIVGVIGSVLKYFAPSTFTKYLDFKRHYGRDLESHAPYDFHKAMDTVWISIQKLFHALVYEINTQCKYKDHAPVYAVNATKYDLTTLRNVIDRSKYTVLLCGSFS
eukprot:703343_1